MIIHHGNFEKTDNFFKRIIQKRKYYDVFHAYGKMGVEELRAATPKDTGETANSWTYDVHISSVMMSIVWRNSKMVNSVPLAVMLQYGYATGSGAWIAGRDYINPALRDIFDKMTENIMREVNWDGQIYR